MPNWAEKYVFLYFPAKTNTVVSGDFDFPFFPPIF